MKSKYYGKVIDGKWVITNYELRNHHYFYTLTNAYNDQTIEITHATLLCILRGETSVSRIMSFRITKSRESKFNYASKGLSKRFYK